MIPHYRFTEQVANHHERLQSAAFKSWVMNVMAKALVKNQAARMLSVPTVAGLDSVFLYVELTEKADANHRRKTSGTGTRGMP
jgi:hypothetical protein